MGKRPNLIRIYDKTAECLVNFRKRSRKVSKDADPLDFIKEYGFTPDTVLTRVERQIGGNLMPDHLATFGKLIKNASDFDPFTNLQIISGQDHAMPTLETCEISRWLTGTRLRELADEWGMQRLRSVINQKSKGNAARFLAQYQDFFPRDGELALTSEKIAGLYRNSVKVQLSA
jgi:hypothetical protein